MKTRKRSLREWNRVPEITSNKSAQQRNETLLVNGHANSLKKKQTKNQNKKKLGKTKTPIEPETETNGKTERKTTR